MKKRWIFILAVLMIAATMFVACNSEVTDARASAQPGEELVYATFGGGSKDLSVNYDFIDYTKLYWFYQATKGDAYGTTGAVTGDDWAKVPGDSEGKGLDGTVGPFSQGLWSFNLAGYETKSTTKPTSGGYIKYGDYYYSGLVYSGASTGTVSLKYGDSNAIPVTVQPYGNTGKIYLNNITYAWGNSSAATGTVTLQIKVTPVEGSSWTDSKTWSYNSGYTLSDYVLNNNSTPSVDIPTGTYNLDFTVCAIVDNDVAYEFAKQSLSLTVFGSQTTTITGSLVEGLFVENAHFVATDVASVIVIPTTTGAAFETNKTPAGSGENKKTTVTVPTGTLTTGTQNNMTIELVSIDIAQDVASQKSWSVATDSSAVAALTITLKEVVTTTDPTTGSVTVEEKPITTFDNAVTVTTYIETGLTGVQVFYNGDLDQPTDVTYDATTGCLTFKTTHFSEFYITSTSEVLNVETGVKYTTLADAVDKAVAGQTLKLIKNITLNEIVEIDKSLILDLGSYTASGSNLLKIYKGEVTIKNGTLEATNYALQIYGKTSNAENYTTVNIASDAEVKGKYSIIIRDTSPSNNLYGVTLNVDGKVTGRNPIWVMGNIHEGNSVININNGAVLTATEGDDTSCIANNGYITTNINDGAILTGIGTAIEVRAGIVNILGGTFSASASPASVQPNGNGTTTKGAAVGVAQHTTELDISVNISGGTFAGYHALYINNPQVNNAGDINISVSGGTFTKNVSESQAAVVCNDSRVSKFITGGKYNTNPSEFVAPGYYAKENTPEAGWWTVKSIFDGSGTKDDPFIIDSVDAWMELVKMCEHDSNYDLTIGKCFKVTCDIDASVYNRDACVQYFGGHIDFTNKEFSGFNSVTSKEGSLFTYVGGPDALIENLTLTTSTIHYPASVVAFNLTGCLYGNVTIKNVTINGAASGLTDNNNGLLSYYVGYGNGGYGKSYDYMFEDCKIYANITGSGYTAAFIGACGFVNSGNVKFIRCENYGNIISTGMSSSMLVSNCVYMDWGGNTIITVDDCKNYGSIIGSDSSNTTLFVSPSLGDNVYYTRNATLNGVLLDNGGEYLSPSSGKTKINNALGTELEGNAPTSISVGSITTSEGKFVLNPTENASKYELAFSFASANRNGGGAGYTFTFSSLPSNGINVGSWITKGDAEASGVEIVEHNEYGTTFYTCGDSYVYYEDGATFHGSNNSINVYFIAYDSNDVVLSVNMFTYQ